MKTTQRRWRSSLLAVATTALIATLTPVRQARADNPCPDATIYGSWNCLSSGTLYSAGIFSPTNIVVFPGNILSGPVMISAPTFTNGLELQLISHTCYTLIISNQSPVLFVPGAPYFVPTLFQTTNTPGNYTFTAMVNGQATSLVGWWPGEGNPADKVFGNNGTVNGGVGYGYGIVGRSFNFNGVDSYIEVTNGPAVNYDGPFTAEAWINFNSISDPNGINIVSKGDDTSWSLVNWGLDVSPNRKLKIYASAPYIYWNTGYAEGTTVLSPGTWYHVAMTYDGTTARGYLNGTQECSYTYGQIDPTLRSFRIGSLVPGDTGRVGKRIFSGSIDEPSFYSCALSVSNILAIYNAGSAGKNWNGSTNGAPLPASCVCSGVSGVTVGTIQVSVTCPPPVITNQPVSLAVPQSANATFSVGAVGNPPLIYQWLFNSAKISGATGSSFTTNNVTTGSAGNYSVIVTNAGGSVTSLPAMLAVSQQISITQPVPTNQTVVQGANASFGITASGSPAINYQWYYNSTNLNTTNVIPFATASNYTKFAVTPADAGNFFIMVSNGVNSITSSNAGLTVIVPPVITNQPTDLTVNLTSNAVFSVGVSSNATRPLSYQWYWNGAVMPGMTNQSLTNLNVQITNVGYYSIIVSNQAGTNVSLPAYLTVALLASNLTNSTAIVVSYDAAFANTSDGRVLELTPSAGSKHGSAFFVNPLTLVSNVSFSTFFTFRLSNPNPGGGSAFDPADGIQGADGITFVVQPITNNVGNAGGGIGYQTIATSMAVEFDTWYNAEVVNGAVMDPDLPGGQTNIIAGTQYPHGDGNHVGLDFDGDIHSVAYQHISPSMNDGNIWYAWIDYIGSTSNIEVRVTNSPVRPKNPTLTTNNVSLINHLGTNTAYIGFTAGTGGAWNQQDVLSWQFITPYHPIGLTNSPPTVSVISPANGSVFPYGPAIGLLATASEQNGIITNVMFQNYGTNLGIAVVGANNTYALAWTNALLGSNSITAVAWDNFGKTSTSSPAVYVIMDNPPALTVSTNFTLIWTEGGANISTNIAFTCNDDGYPFGKLTNSWSTISGPGTVSYSSTNYVTNFTAGSTAAFSTNTTVTFGTNGTYVLQLTANDGAFSTTKNCTVRVLRRPFVSITIPANNTILTSNSSAVISATAYDLDGVVTNVQFFNGPNLIGTIPGESSFYSLLWTNIINKTNLLTAVATDNDGLTNISTTVLVLANSAPVVSAGPAQIITLPVTNVTLSGSVTDDQMPPGASLTLAWSVVSSNGPVSIASPTSATTGASFITNGLYVLRLTASDTAATASSNTTITVNLMPRLNASNQIVNLTSTSVKVGLGGSFTDDGLPVGAKVTPLWSVVSAPGGSVTFSNVSLPNTTATFTNIGVYVLRLSVNDTVSTNTTNVTITVNRIPTVSIASSQTIVWTEGASSTNVTLVGNVTDDGLPFGVTNYLWSVVSSNGSVAFGNATGATNVVTFNTNGVYVLKLTVNDGFATNTATCTITIWRRPFVSIVSPTNTQTFAFGAAITNLAYAYDLDGYVTNLLFYNGTNYLGAGTLIKSTIVFSGAVSHWAAESNGLDSIGTNNGTLQNGLGFAAGEVGLGFLFNGTNADLRIPTSPGLNVGTGGGFTVEAWINPTDVTQDRPLFEWNSLSWWGVHFHIAPGQPFNTSPGPGELYANIVDSSGGWHQMSSPGGVVVSNAFQHVALTYDKTSGLGTIYCNGQIVGQQSFGSFTPQTASPFDLYVGSRPGPSGQNAYFAGRIDEPSLYNRALSQAEIQAIFKAGTNYVFVWTNAPIGTNAIYAVAVDNSGLATTSSVVNVAVGSVMSVVITNPAANAIFVAPGVMPVAANVLSPSAPVQKVEFFAGISKIGEDTLSTSNPYHFVWLGAPAGDYALTAKVTDALNNTATSTSVVVHVVSPIQVNPGMNQVVLLTSNSVISTMVGAILGGAGGTTSVWSQVTGPATAFFANAALTNTGVIFTNQVGSYMFRLFAGDGYTSDSKVMTVTVISNRPPVVDAGPNRIIAPSNMIYLNGTVTDDGQPAPPSLRSWWAWVSGPTNGIIFANSNAPVITASNLTMLGIYTLRLTATDGLSTNSSDMTVTVADPSSRTYTYDADFAEGDLVNVNFTDIANQLQLNQKVTPFPYVWVACTARDSIVRIDANTGQILGEYRTVPMQIYANYTNTYASPSRTTVDRYGNVWVCNRNDNLGNTNGSITRVGLVIGGTRGYKINDLGGTNFTFVADPQGQYLQPPFKYCTAIDRDGDGLIKTSSGLGNVLDWDLSQTSADQLGGVSTADDECIINYTRVAGTGARTVAIDANNNLWVGGRNNGQFQQINGNTGQPVPGTTFSWVDAYGGFIDGSGSLWSSAYGNGDLARFDIKRAFDMSVNPPVIIDQAYVNSGVGDPTTAASYGVGIDPITGFVWFANYGTGGGRVNPFDLSVTNIDFHHTDGGGTKGVAVDDNGNVWIGNDGSSTLSHMRTDGTFVGTVDLGCGNTGPMGVSIDANGKIWAACSSGSAVRVDPVLGPRMMSDLPNSSGFLLGQADLVVGLDTGLPASSPYNYSDMTGYVSLGATEPSGIWRVVHDSGVANQAWGILKWNSLEPSGSGIKVEVRTADNYLQLSATNNAFQQITNGVAFTNLAGRYMEIRATFFHKQGVNVTPVLYDLTVSSGTNAVVANQANFANSDKLTIFENSGSHYINVLDNDIAPPGSPLSITRVSPAGYGEVTIAPGATNLVYTPNTNFFGLDQFSYTATDGHGGVGRAVVTVVVGEAPPAPNTNVFNPAVANISLLVYENSGEVEVTTNGQSVGDFLNSLNYPTNVAIKAVSQPAQGFVRYSSCKIFYTPAPGFYGVDRFPYTVRNSSGLTAIGWVTVNVVHATPIDCGQTLSGTLSPTNPAVFVENGEQVQLYSLAADAYETNVIALDQTAFNSGVLLQEQDSYPIITNTTTYATNYLIRISFGNLTTNQNYALSVSCSHMTAPHMSVLSGTNSLPTGSGIDFGLTQVGSPVTASLTITNSGTAPLIISNVSNLYFGGNFMVTGTSLTNHTITINAGSYSNLTVRFTAPQPGQTNGVLLMFCNDPLFLSYENGFFNPTTNPYVINLTGRANPVNTTAPSVIITNPVANTIFEYTNPCYDTFGTGIPVTVRAAAASGVQLDHVSVDIRMANGSNVVLSLPLAQDNHGNYTNIWYGLPPGSYQLIASAVDQYGLQSNSIPVNVTIATSLQVFFGTNIVASNSLPSGSTILYGSVPIHAEVLAALLLTNRSATSLNVGSFSISSPFRITNGYANSSFVLGGHQSTNMTIAFKSDTGGSWASQFSFDSEYWTRCDSYKLTLSGTTTNSGIPPTVVLGSPASNSVFLVNSDITIRAAATNNSGGLLSHLDFYATSSQGTIYLWSTNISDASGVYQFDWMPALPGQYTLNVVVTDDGGLASVSPGVPVSVVIRPAGSPVMQVFLARTNPVPNFSTIGYGVTLTNKPVLATLTISNSGSSALVLSNAFFCLPDLTPGGGFNLSNGPAFPVSIPVNGYTNLVVRYLASAAVPTNALLMITNNDLAQSPFVITNLGRANIRTNNLPRVAITAPLSYTNFAYADVFNWPGISITVTSAPSSGANLQEIDFYASVSGGNNMLIDQYWSPASTGATFQWTTVPPGNYILTAVAIDDAGFSTVSAPVPVTVLLRATNGPSMKVFYGTNELSNGTTINMGVVPINTEDLVLLTLTNLGPGIYTNNNLYPTDGRFYLTNNLQAGFILAPHTATNLYLAFKDTTPEAGTADYIFDGNDNGLYIDNTWGRLKLSLTAVATALGNPPSIAITNPPNGSVYSLPASIQIIGSAMANHPGGTINHVDFYATSGNNNIYLGTDYYNTSPSYTWNNPPVGRYSLTAVAVDDLGRAGISTNTVIITVINHPTNSPIMQVLLLQTNVVPNFSVLDFGLTNVGASLPMSFTITNLGDLGLDITKIFLTDTNEFQIVAGPDVPCTIPVNGSTNFSVVYQANYLGGADSVLTIYNNDASSQPFYITNIAYANPVNNGNPPVVWITAPTEGSEFAARSDITLLATALSATNSTLADVRFYATTSSGSTLVSDVPAAPGQTNLIASATWSRPAPGNYTIQAIAFDRSGLMGQSTNVVHVVINNIPVNPTNLPPVANDDHLWIVGGVTNLPTYPIDVLANDTDPNGYPLTLTGFDYGTGRLGRMTQNGNRLLFTPYPSIEGTNWVSYTVSDGRGGAATGWLQIVVKMAPLPQVILITPQDGDYFDLPTVLSNRYLKLWAYAYSPNTNLSIASVIFYDADKLLGYGTPTNITGTNLFVYKWNTPAAGWHRITAMVTDSVGQQNLSSAYVDGQQITSPGATIYINGKTNNTPPIAAITNLAATISNVNGFDTWVYPIVSDGILNVLGTANDVDAGDVVSYQILLQKSDGTQVADLTPSPDATGFHPGTDMNGVLATNVNLSMYENGTYDIVLNVFDGWEISSDTARILLNTQLKIGNFSFSVQDAVIPVSGIPLTVTRTYNSFNLDQGAFGYSWTYAINDVNLQLDEDRQMTAELDTGDQFSLRTGGGRDVTLTLPNGRRVTFQFSFGPVTDCGDFGGYGQYCYPALWQSPPGVDYALATADKYGNVYTNMYNGLTGYWNNQAGTGFENFDFPGFALIAPDGTKYIITREDDDEHFFDSGSNDGYYAHTYGVATLTKIIEPDGDSISIQPDSIQHYDPLGVPTKSIRFTRDLEKRIIAISDPNSGSNGLPSMQYVYGTNGNLVHTMKLTDWTANAGRGAYDVTTYQYTNTHFLHFITGILGPNGVQMAKTLYDDSGRIIEVDDADGKKTQFIHDLTNHVEVNIDRLGRSTSYVYDLRGNVMAETNALGYKTVNTYDASNHLTSTADPLGYATRFVYDNAGNQVQVIDAGTHTNFFTYDGNGRLLTQTYPLGNVTENLYDEFGNLTNTIQYDANNVLINESFSTYSDGNLLQKLDAFGRTNATLGYDGDNLQVVTDARGFSRIFGYDANGNRTNSSYVWTNAAGVPVTVTAGTIYDAQGRVTMTIDADGNTSQTFYNSLGKVDHTVDKFGNISSFIYDARDNLIQSTYPDGTLTRIVYDDDGEPFFTVDKNQTTATLTHYDAIGRATNTIRYMGVVVNLMADTVNPDQMTTVIVSYGTPYSTNSTVYLANGWVQSRTGPDGRTATYEYYPDGQRKQVVDPLNNTNSYAYDDAGHRTNTVDALGHTIKSCYDALGRQVATIFPDNSYTTNIFNAVGQRIGEQDQALLLTQFGYDISGQMTGVIKPTVTDPENGNAPMPPQWNYQYDQYGRQMASIDPKGRTNTFTYDAPGRQLTHGLPLGQVETNIYATDTTTNHIKGQLWRHYDFLGQRTEYLYDQFGRMRAKYLFAVNGAVPTNSVSYTYNALGQLAQIKENYGTNASQGYAYLGGGHSGPGARMLAFVGQNPEASGGVTALALMALAAAAIPRRKRRELMAFALEIYDEHRELFAALIKAAQATRRRGSRRLRLPSYGWRFATLITLAAIIGNEPGMDSLWTARADYTYPSNASTPTTRYTFFAYDIDGHLVQINTSEGVVNYGYELATGRLIETNTKNSDVQYTYDGLGRLKTVHAIKRNGTTINETTTYNYDAVGNRSEVDLPNGIVTKYAYDSLNRMTNLTHQVGSGTITNLASYNYRLNSSGRRTNAVEVLRQEDGTYLTNTLAWAYDGLYRLTNEVSVSKSAGGTYAYTNSFVYDLAGNRLQQVKTGTSVTTITNSYDANDELLREVTKVNSALTDTNSYAYDTNGSMTGRTNASGTMTYTYNVANKLTGALSTGTLVASYLYDDQGIRVSQTANGGITTKYLIDANNHTGFAQVLEEFTTATTPSMSYVLGDETLAQCGITATAPSYFLPDGHGSNRQLAQMDGTIFKHYTYDAYGTVQTGNGQVTASSSTAEVAAADDTSRITSKLYGGEQYDSNLQMYNQRARYYNPGNGRFNQRDTFAGVNSDPQTLHKYLYCSSDPVNMCDPSGLLDMIDIIGVSAIIGTIAAFYGAGIAHMAGKSAWRGAIAGAALGTGIGIALATENLIPALIAGLMSGLVAVLIDSAYNVFVKHGDMLDEETNFDFFETFCWGVLDSSIDPEKLGLDDGSATVNTLKTFSINAVQIFVNFLTSNESKAEKWNNFATEAMAACALGLVNLGLELLHSKYTLSWPSWVASGFESKIGQLLKLNSLNEGADEKISFTAEQLRDLMIGTGKKYLDSTNEKNEP